jgi:hypothetical protein
MTRKFLSPLVLVPLLAFALAGTAAQTPASAPAAAAVAPAPVPAAGPPALTLSPAICGGLPGPGAMKSEALLPLPTPAFCPPPCPACNPPSRCTAPCQVHFGCTICTCHR